MSTLSQWEMIERLVVALILGALLGFERERRDKASGHQDLCAGL